MAALSLFERSLRNVGFIIDSREQGWATQSAPPVLVVVLFYTVFTGCASGLELTPC